jgi:tRNA nucleotidyltransferase/poly(A) polymerase
MKRASTEHDKQIALMKFLASSAKRLGVADHVYVVGGAVRNFVLNQPIKDIDVVVDPTVTGKDSAWLAEKLDRLIPTDTSFVTNQYGVAIITVKGSWMLDGHDLKGEVIEIANTRKESYGGESGKGYKPSEVLPATVLEDVARREFSMNSLLWRMSELASGPDKAEILDLTGCGLEDLKNGLMRCPSDPDQTFADDPTRMIRAIKFMLRYNFKPTKDTEAAIRRNAQKLLNVPHEAVAKLLVTDLFKEKTYAKALEMMDRLGLLEPVRTMMKEHEAFLTYMRRWITTKPVMMLFDLLDMGIPMEENLNFLSKDQQQQLRSVAVTLNDNDSIALLEGLRQPSSVWKDKSYFTNMTRDLGLSPKDIPKFNADLTAKARTLLLEDPKLVLNPESFRGLLRAQVMTKTASVKEPVDYTSVTLDESEPLLRWFKNQFPLLPFYHAEHGILNSSPSEEELEATKLGSEVTVHVIGVINTPDLQAVEVVLDKFAPTEGRVFIPVASTSQEVPVPDKYWNDYVMTIPGISLPAKFTYGDNGSHFTKKAASYIRYTGLILENPDDLLKWYRFNINPRLLKRRLAHHVTLEFEPQNLDLPWGKKVDVTVTGFVDNDEIQAVKVKIPQEFTTPRIPHVTVATQGWVEASTTNKYMGEAIAERGPALKARVGWSDGKEVFFEAPKLSKTASLLPIMEPIYNLREIAKQMILLEDHLFQPRKQCPDCIDKHLMCIEALGEEMVTLCEADSPFAMIGVGIAEIVRYLYVVLDHPSTTLESRFRQAADMLRKVRKEISKATREHRTFTSPSRMLDKTATKSDSEKEDEAASDLVKGSPKYKPPRKDSRKERMDVADPDLSKRDPDLSLNYKSV